MLDPTGNFIISTVDTAPDPADEGSTLTVDSADEGLFTSLIAVGAFNAVVWPFGVEPRISSAEIIRVTDITDGVFTIERGQEGTTARNIATGWSIAVTPTTKMMDDIQTDLSSRVPYTGADSDIDINDKSITSVNEINFGNNTLIGSQSAESGNLWLQGASAATALYLFANDASYSAILNISGLADSDKTFTFPNASGTFAITDDIPTDISELTDSTGIIPSDVSDLTDTTGIIPADVSDLTDTTGVIPVDVSDLTDTTSVIPTDVNELDDTSGLISGKIAKTTDITAINDTGIADGEIAVFNKTNKDIRTSDKFLPSGDVVGTTDTQTLTNKTLTNPTVNFTDKAVTQGVMCYAYLATTQSNLTNNTVTKVTLDAEVFDVGGDFDIANNRFVAPVSGYYHIMATVTFSGVVADKRYIAYIYVNGAQVNISSMSIGTVTTGIYIPVMALVYVEAGQYIELYAESESGDNTVDIVGGTKMWVMLVSI